MKCDELRIENACVYGPNAKVYLAEQVDAAIAELKQTIDELMGVKKSAEQILKNLLDCGLIKEWYFNGKFNAVLKYEANKVFADLEESNKMEVEQLLIEIVELKVQKAQAEDDCAYWKMSEGNAVNAMHETEEYAMQLYKELRHQKYKRCLAMAWWCSAELGMLVSTWEFKIKHYKKWQKRWFELAEKFKT